MTKRKSHCAVIVKNSSTLNRLARRYMLNHWEERKNLKVLSKPWLKIHQRYKLALHSCLSQRIKQSDSWKLLQSTQVSISTFSSKSSCFFAQNGNISSFLCTISNCSWIVDSRQTNHMTGYSGLFSSYKPCAGNTNIKIADGTLSTIGVGNVRIPPSFSLSNILLVPKLSYNLISVSKQTHGPNC